MSDRSGSESPLSATWRPAVQERAVLVGLSRSGSDGEALDELAALARAAGAEPVGRIVQARSSPDPTTFVGKGKLGDIHDLVHAKGADAVILDVMLPGIDGWSVLEDLHAMGDPVPIVVIATVTMRMVDGGAR